MKSFVAITSLFTALAIAQVPAGWPSSGVAPNMTVTGFAQPTIPSHPVSAVAESTTIYFAPFSNNQSTWSVPQTVTYETGFTASQPFTVMKCGPLSPCNTTTTASSSAEASASAKSSLWGSTSPGLVTSTLAAQSTVAEQATASTSVPIATHTGAAVTQFVSLGAVAFAGLAMFL